MRIQLRQPAPTDCGRNKAQLVRTVRYVASWRRYRIRRGRRVQDATVCPLFVPMCDRPGMRGADTSRLTRSARASGRQPRGRHQGSRPRRRSQAPSSTEMLSGVVCQHQPLSAQATGTPRQAPPEAVCRSSRQAESNVDNRRYARPARRRDCRAASRPGLRRRRLRPVARRCPGRAGPIPADNRWSAGRPAAIVQQRRKPAVTTRSDGAAFTAPRVQSAASAVSSRVRSVRSRTAVGRSAVAAASVSRSCPGPSDSTTCAATSRTRHSRCSTSARHWSASRIDSRTPSPRGAELTLGRQQPAEIVQLRGREVGREQRQLTHRYPLVACDEVVRRH